MKAQYAVSHIEHCGKCRYVCLNCAVVWKVNL
jgi:hypothetical protein